MTEEDGCLLNNEKRYTIGQIAELCHVSKRILRYYDQNGIVVPACRDKVTNYRYYTENQVEQILLLQELRELSLPVKTIARLFPDRDLMTFELELEQHLKELREELADLQTKYDRTLDVFLRVVRGRIAIEDIRKVPEPRIQLVHFHKRMVAFTHLSGIWDSGRRYVSCRGKLMQILADNHFRPVGSPLAVIYSGCQRLRGNKDETGLDFAVEINEGKNVGQCKRLDGFDAISSVCVGSYEKLDACYVEMEHFARENNMVLKEMTVEEYLVGPTMTNDPDQYVTRLYIPIQK